MQTSNGDSDSNPTSGPTLSPSIGIPETERPPVFKRSKTIADETGTAHFPGPLFPAVRRVSTSPSSFHRNSDSPTSSSSSSTPSGISVASSVAGPSSFSDRAFNFADRDYVYPSFLGPYATRSRVNVKPPSKSAKVEPPLGRSLARNAPLPSNLTVDVSRPKLDSVHKIGAAIPPRPGKLKQEPRPKMAKLKGEKELNPLTVQLPATSSSSSSSTTSNPSANSYSPRKPPGFKSSWILNLVSFIYTCTAGVIYSVWVVRHLYLWILFFC